MSFCPHAHNTQASELGTNTSQLAPETPLLNTMPHSLSRLLNQYNWKEKRTGTKNLRKC